MQALNLPPFPFKIVEEKGKLKIFDPIRRKYLVLTPEEWVRQHFIQYLIGVKKFPKGLLRLEGGVASAQRTGRYDALFLTPSGKPLLLIECKAPGVKITGETFFQIARYNGTLGVSYFAVTNGLDHYFVKINPENKSIDSLDDLPLYDALITQ